MNNDPYNQPTVPGGWDQQQGQPTFSGMGTGTPMPAAGTVPPTQPVIVNGQVIPPTPALPGAGTTGTPGTAQARKGSMSRRHLLGASLVSVAGLGALGVAGGLAIEWLQ